MNVGQLKEALTKLSDNLEVLLMTADGKGSQRVDILCATGYMHVGNSIVGGLVGMSEIQRQVESGELAKPEGYVSPTVEGDEWKQG
jgi:hypothetical protein